MKMHLRYMDGPLVVCGQIGVRLEKKVDTLEETTCLRCIKIFEGNKEYYQKHIKQPAVAMTFDAVRMNAGLAKVRENLEKMRIRRSARKGYCGNCGSKIRVMSFLDTNHCSENCRKELEEKNA